jgi:DNA mismatch repair protein MLH1
MLDEYFSLRINERGQLESLPLLMGDYTPNLDKLPLFLMRLGPQVHKHPSVSETIFAY